MYHITKNVFLGYKFPYFIKITQPVSYGFM